MIVFPAAFVLGFAGGFAVGAGVYGRGRRPSLAIWMALPFTAWTGFLLFGLARGATGDWRQAIGWWLIGFGYVGLPMLVFAAGGLLGFAAAPAPRRRWRLRDWRLPQ